MVDREVRMDTEKRSQGGAQFSDRSAPTASADVSDVGTNLPDQDDDIPDEDENPPPQDWKHPDDGKSLSELDEEFPLKP